VRVAASYSFAETTLVFDGATDASFERHAVVVTGEKRLGERATVQFGSGGVAGGSLAGDSIAQGWLALAGFSYRILDGRGSSPFLLASAAAGALSARTGASHLFALDVRGGLAVGKRSPRARRRARFRRAPERRTSSPSTSVEDSRSGRPSPARSAPISRVASSEDRFGGKTS
jgi:hypothetical protein